MLPVIWEHHYLISHIRLKTCFVTAIATDLPLKGLTGAADMMTDLKGRPYETATYLHNGFIRGACHTLPDVRASRGGRRTGVGR